MPTEDITPDYKLFFELSPDLLCIAGYDGYFKKINNSLSKLLGYTLDELYNKPINNFVYKEDKDITSQVREELTQAKPLYSFENRYVKKNGDLVWLSWTSFPVESKKCIYAIAKDITHKKSIEINRDQLLADLTKMNEELKQITYITSHDLRSPVSNLLSVFSLMEGVKIYDEEALELIEFLKISSEQLKHTLDDYIDLLSEKHEHYTNKELVVLDENLRSVLQTLDALIKTSKTSIKVDFSKVNIINFNKTYLQSIFLNLITNAIKYSRANCFPEIKIHTEKEGNYAKIIFSDNGKGMNKDLINKNNFEFINKEKRSKESKGIGLYLVYSHMNSFGGKVEIRSEEEKGTTFILSFKVRE